MSEILTSLLEAGLIENIDGDETRFEKIESAAKKLANALIDETQKLIPAILAGINPDVRSDDPAIEQAKEMLVSEWKTMSSAYPSSPINLFRAVLLEACRLAAEEHEGNAAILWLTAADSLCFMRLGKEEQVVTGLLESFARKTELWATKSSELPKSPREAVVKITADAADTSIPKVNRANLLDSFGGAAAPNFTKEGANVVGTNPNRYNPGQSPVSWAGDFADRMTAIFGTELDSLAQKTNKALSENTKQTQDIVEQVEKALNDQRLFIQRVAKENISAQTTEAVKLNVLWWSEALYSPSFNDSYRELPLPLATVAMPLDLLLELAIPTPASVSYLLSETVCKLNKASFQDKFTLKEVLSSLNTHSDRMPECLTKNLSPAPSKGLLTLRDLATVAITENQIDLDGLLQRANIPLDFEISAPTLSRAIFRQEQAIMLIGEG